MARARDRIKLPLYLFCAAFGLYTLIDGVATADTWHVVLGVLLLFMAAAGFRELRAARDRAP